MDVQTLLEQTGRFVIDGSMSTPLEQMGADLNCSLWTARALIKTPEIVKKVHKDYLRAGADCGITCSYQASIKGLIENGYTHEEAQNIIRRSVILFQEARDEWWAEEGEELGRAWPLCLASVGPYGAYLADGSEYRGSYSISDAIRKAYETADGKNDSSAAGADHGHRLYPACRGQCRRRKRAPGRFCV